jgi:hypothetical protein
MTEPEDIALSDHLTPDERDPEAPDADAYEQATLAQPDDVYGEPAVSGSLEAPDWDAYEQALTVPVDDDYR